jgi:hypothetical protein
MIFGKPEQKTKPAAAEAAMPSAANLPTASAALGASTAAAEPPAGPAAAPGPAPAAGGSPGNLQRQAATIRYVDRPDVGETFADSITGLVFDGQTLRIEFGVTRVDEVKPDAPITGRRYPTSRIVLSPGAAIELSTACSRSERPSPGPALRRPRRDAGRSGRQADRRLTARR